MSDAITSTLALRLAAVLLGVLGMVAQSGKAEGSKHQWVYGAGALYAW